MEYSPYVGGLGELPPILGFGGISISVKLVCLAVHPLVVHYALSCTLLCLTYLPWLHTTVPLVTVVSSGLSSISSVTMAPSLMGLPVTLGQCEGVLPPPLMLRYPGGVIGHASVPQQQPPSSMPLLTYANSAMGFSTGRFLFQS